MTLVLAAVLATGPVGGCAARRPVVVHRPPPSPHAPERATAPADTVATPPGPERATLPPLPGANRVYPSQDPRSQVAADAPEAFPAGGTTTTLPVPDAPGEAPAAIPPARQAGWSVQLLASASAEVARERALELARHFAEPPRVEPAAGLFKVRVGWCASRDEAEVLRRRAVALGLRDAFVVPVEPGGGPLR